MLFRSQFYTESQPSFGSEGTLEKWSYLGSYGSVDGTRVVYGVEQITESIDDGTFDTQRDKQGYYLEYQGNLDDQLFLTAGVRRDENDDFDGETTFRISAAYLVSTDSGQVKLRGAYGSGFRAPSLYEIAYNSGFFAYPPASEVSLSPETSAGHDLGVEWYGDNGLYLEATYFDQLINDEIYFDQASYSGYLQDSGETDSRGIELALETPLSATLALTEIGRAHV